MRYTVAWPPLELATCSCRNCQKQSGSALSMVAVLARDAITVEGALATYLDTGTSGQAVRRRFCQTCGSPVLTETPRADVIGLIFLKAGTLDDTADLVPVSHYWTERAQAWMRYPESDRRCLREECEEETPDADHRL